MMRYFVQFQGTAAPDSWRDSSATAFGSETYHEAALKLIARISALAEKDAGDMRFWPYRIVEREVAQ